MISDVIYRDRCLFPRRHAASTGRMEDQAFGQHHRRSTLLTGDDVPPVHELNAAGRSPFLLTCDHYGRLIPAVLGDLGLPEPELARHIAWDIGSCRRRRAAVAAARRPSGRATLFAAGDRLQPAAECRKLDPADQRSHHHSRQ